MDLKQIKELIALMKKNDLSVFKLEQEGFKITLKKGGRMQVSHVAAPTPLMTGGNPAIAVETQPPAQPDAALSPGKSILSPMVGTFYRAGSPDAAPFVEVGTEVSEETVVCIIEAMKVMNEIKAERSGVVAEVLVENARPVEFGQPLFRLK